MIKKLYGQLEAAYGSDAYGSSTLCRAYLTELLVLLNRADVYKRQNIFSSAFPVRLPMLK